MISVVVVRTLALAMALFSMDTVGGYASALNL